ncbi:ring-opening amidohydrolase [Pseudooceanicola sp. 200-1SW]|uniref:cyanuric acid amidohydrolase n=1 Tax=Pseudooceanicola sp. 200-1SW TaxID=3425949 RepID=UPI003D7FDA74
MMTSEADVQAKVYRLSMAHPGDLSALAELLATGELAAQEIVAVIGKTEGNGGVNDFTRGYFTDRLMHLLSGYLNETPEALARKLPCILSGGTEGVLSPHYTVLCRSAAKAGTSESNPALAIGAACSVDMPFDLVGTRDHAVMVAQTVRAAMADAGLTDPGDLHFVQVKVPCLTSGRIADLRAAGRAVPAPNAAVSMARARAAGALGVALATGEITEAQLDDAAFLADFDLYSTCASISSGVEVLCNEVIVLGMSAAWSGPLRIAHRAMEDAIDLPSVQGVFQDLGFGPGAQVCAAERARLKAIFVKCEPDQSGQIHGARHTMLNDTDIDPQRHIRGAVGGLVAGVAGETRIFVSGGAEHQGPYGGGLIAVIAEAGDPQTEGAVA